MLKGWRAPSLAVKNRRREGQSIFAYSYIADTFLVTPRAKEIISKEFGSEFEWLPAKSIDGDLYFANCINVVDLVDIESSEIEYYGDDKGGVGSVKQYVPKIDIVERFSVIRWSAKPNTTFITSRFVDFLESAQLKGMDPDPIWDSEVAPYSRYAGRAEIAERPEVFGPNGFRRGFEHAWPEEWKPASKRRKSSSPSSPPAPARPAVQVSDCTSEELDWIEQRRQAGMALLSLSDDQVRKDAVMSVYDWVNGRHSARPVGPPSAQTMPSTDDIDAAACVVAHAFVAQFGWTWRAVDEGHGQGRHLVVMATDGFYIDPWREIERSLAVPPEGQRAAVFGIPMAFNLMAAGEYPEITEPGFLAVNLLDRMVRLV